MYKLDNFKPAMIAVLKIRALVDNDDIAVQICSAAIDKGTVIFTDKHGKWHRLDWWQA